MYDGKWLFSRIELHERVYYEWMYVCTQTLKYKEDSGCVLLTVFGFEPLTVALTLNMDLRIDCKEVSVFF